MIGFAAVVTFLIPWIVPWWTRDEVTSVPLALSLGFSAFLLTNVLTGPTAMVLNGAHVIGVQIWGAIAMALVNVASSIYLTHLIGLSGPIWGTVVGQLLVTIPVNVWATQKALK
jgi:O-antigen/teichoic acid export membrane protein